MNGIDIQPSMLLWQKLYEAAEIKVRNGNHKAKDTIKSLERMKEACDDIISGKAKDKAVEAKHSASLFFKRQASPETIMNYCKKVLGYPGPHSVTIRNNREWLSYIEARNDEANSNTRPSRPSNHQKEINKALDRIGLMDDRDLLWREIEIGRKAQAELNVIRHFLTQLAPINLDKLKDGRLDIESIRSASVGLDIKSRRTVNGLVARLTDNEFLGPFELAFNGKSVQMSYGPRSNFINMDEIVLLKRLVGIADTDGERGDDPEPVA